MRFLFRRVMRNGKDAKDSLSGVSNRMIGHLPAITGVGKYFAFYDVL
jgi:hypothetical protein